MRARPGPPSAWRPEPGARLAALHLAGLFAAGLAARLAWMTAVVGWSAWADDDNRLYHAEALALLEGRPMGVRWSPLLPLLDAALMTLLGPTTLAPKLVVLAAGAAIPPLVGTLAARWAGRRVGLVAGLAAACHPFLVADSASAMTQPLHAALLLAALVAAPVRPDRATARGLLAGLCLGLAALARPTGVALAAIAVAVAAITPARTGSRRRSAAVALAMAAGLAACLAPWAMHAQRVTGRLLLSTTGGGSTLLGANCQRALDLGEAWLPRHDCEVLTESERRALEAADPIEEDRILRAAALRDLRAHPGRWPRLLAVKFASFWGWGTQGWQGSLPARAALLLLTASLPLAGLGAWHLLRPGTPPSTAREAALFVAATLAISLVFWGGHRMRQPVEPLLAAFAATGFVRTVDGLRGRTAPRV